MEEKNVYFANFNITFGKEELPMLVHFKDVIHPAFLSELKRGDFEKHGKEYSFNNVEVKKIKNEYILTGNFVKRMEYERKTILGEKGMKDDVAKLSSDPYSRFLVFLKNHRMILVKNEPVSPDIRSFQSTLKKVIDKYRSIENKKRRDNNEELLPYAIVNIVDIPSVQSIVEEIKDLKKMNSLSLNFFPLNLDFPEYPFNKSFRDEIDRAGAQTGNATINTPTSKKGVKEIIKKNLPYAKIRLRGVDKHGERKTITEKSFTSSVKIALDKNITSEDDEYMFGLAKDNPDMNVVSDGNANIYKKHLAILENFLNKF